MVLIVAGGLLLVDVAVTVLWQEPVSALYSHFQQRAVAAELAGAQRLSDLQLRRLARLRTARRRIAFLAGVLARRIRAGEPLGRLRIRRVGIDFVVVQGTDGASLRLGSGPLSRHPTARTARHRRHRRSPHDVHGSVPKARPHAAGRSDRPRDPVRPLPLSHRAAADHLAQGVSLRLAPRGIRPALTACHPIYSARQRIVVFARLRSVQPRGRARVAARL